jgi:hypothetical protein
MEKLAIFTILFLLVAPILVNADLRQDLETIANNALQDPSYPDYIERAEKALPLAGKITLTDKDEVIFATIDKQGTITFDDSDEYDLIITGTEQDILALKNISDISQIQDKVSNLVFSSETFKGNLALTATEEYLQIELNKDLSFSQKITRIFIKPLLSLFIK